MRPKQPFYREDSQIGTERHKKTNTALSPSEYNPLSCSTVRILPSQITHYYQQKSNCVSQAQQRMLECIKTQTQRIQKHEIHALRTQKSISHGTIQLVSRGCIGFDPHEGTARSHKSKKDS